MEEGEVPGRSKERSEGGRKQTGLQWKPEGGGGGGGR